MPCVRFSTAAARLCVYCCCWLVVGRFLGRSGAAAKVCRPTVRLVSKQVFSSKVVVVAHLTGLQPWNQRRKPTQQLATFQVDKCYKGGALLAEGQRFTLPVSKAGNADRLSESRRCLSARFLERHNRTKLVLFLRPTDLQRHRFVAVFKSRPWTPNLDERISKLLRTGPKKRPKRMKLAPIYEIQLNTAVQPTAVDEAEVNIGDAAHLRCSIQGRVHDDSKIIWLLEGEPLRSDRDTRIHIRKNQMVSTVKIARISAKHIGLYECGARTTFGKYIMKKMIMRMRPTPFNSSLFGDELCTGDKQQYCMNGGLCLYNPSSNSFFCKCRPEYVGPRCEYKATAVIGSVQAFDLSTSQMHNVLFGLLAALGLAVLVLIGLFIFCVKKKNKSGCKCRWPSKLRHFRNIDVLNDEDTLSTTSQVVTCKKCRRELTCDCEKPVQAMRSFQPVRLTEAWTQWSPQDQTVERSNSFIVCSPALNRRSSKFTVAAYSDESNVDVAEMMGMLKSTRCPGRGRCNAVSTYEDEQTDFRYPS